MAIESRNLACWFLSGLLGFWPAFIRYLARDGFDRQTEVLLTHGGLFLGGVALGFFWAAAYWRWPLGTLLMLPVGRLVSSPDLGDGAITWSGLTEHLKAGLNEYVISALVVMVGCSIGAFISTPE